MAELITSPIFFYALLGGFLPALFWLWFWLHEDKKNPEPKGMILLTFVSGMVAVPIAIFFEMLTQKLFFSLSEFTFAKILIWAGIEEVVKYFVVAIGAFTTRSYNEPIDAVMYMITAALGFAALENTFFLTSILQNGELIDWFTTGNSRFIGAVVLHTVSSGLVGAAVGFAFYRKKKWIKYLAVFLGLTTATLLHTGFNFLIIQSEGKNTMEVFFALWVVAIIAIVIFEKVRKTKPAQKNIRN